MKRLDINKRAMGSKSVTTGAAPEKGQERPTGILIFDCLIKAEDGTTPPSR
jgi:hypothetical protein